MEIKVCGVDEINQHKEWYTHIISILDPDYPFSSKGENHLWLKFNDIERIMPWGIAPSLSHIKETIEFLDLHKPERLLVHCALGGSRSPAMAIGILMLRGMTEDEAYEHLEEIRPNTNPNRRVLRCFEDILRIRMKRIRE